MIRRKPVNRKVDNRPVLYTARTSFWEWLKVGGLILVFMACLVGLYQFFVGSDFFRVKEVELTGVPQHDSRKELLALAEVPFGQNLFTVDLNEIQAHLMRSAWVRDVQVRRWFPDRLHIYVEEYQAIATVCGGVNAGDFEGCDGPMYYLDREGKLFKRLGSRDVVISPVILGFEEAELEKYPSYSRLRLNQVFGFLKSFLDDPANEGLKAEKMVLEESEGFSLVVRAGEGKPSTEILMTDWNYDDVRNAWIKMASLMKDKNEAFRFLDLRVKGKIFARY